MALLNIDPAILQRISDLMLMGSSRTFDTIKHGWAGKDVIDGGKGNDALFGEAGDAFDVHGDNGDDIVWAFDTDSDVLQLEGVTSDGKGVDVIHTNGWLTLNFDGGGSVTFTNNLELAGVDSVAELNKVCNVQYADGLA